MKQSLPRSLEVSMKNEFFYKHNNHGHNPLNIYGIIYSEIMFETVIAVIS